MKHKHHHWSNKTGLRVFFAEMAFIFLAFVATSAILIKARVVATTRIDDACLGLAVSEIEGMVGECSIREMNDSLQGLHPYPGAYVSAIDSTDTFVIYHDSTYVGKVTLQELMSRSDYLIDAGLFNRVRSGERNHGYFMHDSRRYMVCFTSIPQLKWTVMITVPLREVVWAPLIFFIKMCVVMLFAFGLVLLVDFYVLRQLSKATRENARIDNELQIAHDLQMGMVPKTFPPYPERKELDIYACLEPAKEVGGDLYDYVLDGDDFYFCIGDVSGKGVPASLFMSTTRSLFRSIVRTEKEPAAIATSLNNAVSEGNEKNMFVTMIIGSCNLKTGDFACCNCGHNIPVTNANVICMDPMTVGPTTTARFMSQLPTNLPIGAFPGFEYKQIGMKLTSGTAILLYTDGITEAENKKHKLFGDERLIETVSRMPRGCTSQEIIEGLLRKLQEFTHGAVQSDDITAVAFRYI